MIKRKKILFLIITSIITLSACQQKPVAVKSEKAQEETKSEQETSSTKDDAAQDKTKKSSKTATLSDDIYAFQVSINGKIMKFPMAYAKFVKYGWEYQGDEEASIPAEDGMMSDWFKKDEDQAIAYLTNFDIQNIPVPSSYVTGMILTKDYIKGEDSKIILPNEIELGVSTEAEVTEAYGEPTVLSQSDTFPTMTYELETNQFVELVFDKRTGDVLSEITMKNEVEPDDFEVSEDTYEAPEAVTDYVTPAMVSTDLFDYTVSFDGALYSLPAPVFEYITNGWTLVESKSDMLIESGKTGKVTLMKDNQTFWTNVMNLGENTDEVINCFVTNLSANVKDCNVEMEISGGIKMGMSQEDFEKAIAAYEYKKEVSNYTYYEIEDPDQKDCGYEVIVKDGKVTGIEIED